MPATPDPDDLICDICGPNNNVTNPDGVVSIPTQPDQTCSELLAAAELGNISPVSCVILLPFAFLPCGCMPATPDPDDFICEICGPDNTVTSPDGVVSIPGQPDQTCTELLVAAQFDNIPPISCAFLPPFTFQPCGCMPATPFECPICGEGKVVGDPNGIVSIPTQPDRTCSDLLAAADMENITRVQCALLQPFVAAPCECMDGVVATPAPVEPTGTPAPVIITPAPVPDAPSTPAPAPDVVEPPSTPAPATEDPTAAPSGVSALLTTKNAISLMGLSLAMLVQFSF
jgi:hypothetical protein